MKDDDDGLRLDAQLAALRAALRVVRAPADDESKLRMALARRQHSRVVAARTRRWRAPLAAAAGIAVTSTALLLGLVRDSADSIIDATPVETAAPDTSRNADAQAASGAFQPLMYSPGLAPAGAYNVVRVRIPLEALAPAHRGGRAAIEADLLVGEDGLARGIRFDAADTLFVSTISR